MSRFTWKDAISPRRPELKERLPVIMGNEPPVGPFATLDTSKTESVLEMRNYIKWQATVLATVDDLLRVEKESCEPHKIRGFQKLNKGRGKVAHE
ncbi:hypothetical protein EDB86DRAFT_2897691 [Lactarius hatsudake]|nr:hypothetical protein EDB86DRAFT_2897691 [Lactarius hatsudake]